MREYMQFAVNLAKEAGGIMRANFMLGMKKEWKEDSSPVTETDLQINQLVVDSVARVFPGHSVLAEEGSAIIDGSEYTWVCDPVDGTLPFSHGIPTFMFSLALVREGQPLLGVVYDPMLDRMYMAQKDGGAYLNGERIHVSTVSSVAKKVMDLEVPSNMAVALSVGNLWAEVRALEGKIIRFASIVYGGALVACGELCVAVYWLRGAHDIAALKIIVEEAGGRVTDLEGNDQRYDRAISGAVITNGLVHEEMLRLMKKHGADSSALKHI